jgi:hypothetical protein
MMAKRSVVEDIRAAQAAEASEELAQAEVVPFTAYDETEVFDNIPIPTGRSARESKYNWDINVGQSVFYPGLKLPTVTTAVSNRNKKGDKKFIARKWTGKSGTLGVMIWRTV